MSDTPDFDADPGETAVESSAAAIGLALGAAEKDRDIAADAREFLRKQSRYLDPQMEDLHEQRDLTLSHLRWRRFNDQMRAAWQASFAILAVLAVVVIGVATWSADEANGLVVRSLKTPLDFAARGLDGSVLAQRLLDKLNGLVAESEPIAFRSADSMRGDWGDESKVEIPQTGISVEELSRALRDWLGQQTHVSGEIWPTANGIAVTVRADANTGVAVMGKQADLDKLLDRAAEKILAQTRPYRYAGVLVQRGLYTQAVAFLMPIARGASQADRAWAYTFWSNTLVFAGKNRESIPFADIAIRLDPTDPSGYFSRLSAEADLQQTEPALRDVRAMDRLISGHTIPEISRSRPPQSCGSRSPSDIARRAAIISAPRTRRSCFRSRTFTDTTTPIFSSPRNLHKRMMARLRVPFSRFHAQWTDSTAVQFSPAVGAMMPNYFVLANVGQWSLAAADAADRAHNLVRI